MKWMRIALAFAALAACPVASAGGTLVVPPRPIPGPYAVGCSDLAQDFTRVAPGEDVQDFWEGVPRGDGSPRYITNLLSDAGNTLAATVNVPADSAVYGSLAGQSLPYVILVCYPTANINPRADYPLPNGKSIPRMQQGAVAPILPDSTTKFPLLLFSHGYLGSPTSNDYIDALALLASYGYIVAAPFHGDGRFGSLQLESFSDLAYVLVHLRDFLGMQAVRALSLSATLDVLLANPQWSTHIDPVRIGGFGASLGGESLLLMAGAGLTTSIGLSWTEIKTDLRLKAAVGYVPYFGYPVFPAFGRDEHGLDNVALPYLAIGGTADTTAPIAEIAVGLQRLQGPRELVALTGVKHGFDVTSAPDIFTWALTFLDAELRGDANARALLPQIASVAGGGDDHVIVPLAPPASVNYGGLWWKSPPGSESGWGLNLSHQGDDIFATWFTYNGAGRGYWLVMLANKMPDGTYRGTLYESHGPPYFATPFDPDQVVAYPKGTGTLSFADADTGTFTYTVENITQSKPITREVFGSVPTCAFGMTIDPARALNYQDLWWAYPAGIESGWGVNLTQQGGAIFLTWFTYDEANAPLWLVATTTAISPTEFTGTLYRTTGPPFYAVPFNPAGVAISPVGTVDLTFQNGNLGTFAYTVNGIAQAKAITRQLLVPPGTLCQ
ncbi:MAG: hypothetical protein ABI569_07765 [Casimicrobiaceae bacterium]